MKNKILRLFVLFALSAGLSVAYAERVSQEDAAVVAGNFMQVADTSSSQGAKAPVRPTSLKRVTLAEEAQFYVYENASGEGWVMVAANDVAHPILAYSDEGQFRTDNQPANLKSWLGGYNKQIKYAEDNNLEATEEVKSEWQALRKGVRKAKTAAVVSPLLTTLWDQDNPYWNLCPKKSEVNTYTGCVATAMAQVMNYWEWPETGTGSASVTCSGTTYTVNFANTTYDWSNMNNKYAQYYKEGDQYYTEYSLGTTAQQNAVATLMYHCGVAVEMDYGTADEGGSGAQTIRYNSTNESYRCAQNALWKNFGYKKSEIKGYLRNGGSGYSSWTKANWIAMLKEELDAKRPIMYAGGDSQNQSGHSFVCDGYDSDSKFHFNWGWSGYCNGYYDVDALDPGPGGSGSGDSGDYSYYQDVIVGIVPDKPDITITWSVNGVTSTTTQTSGTLVLPATPPSDCSGSGGKKFVGWTASSSLSGSAPADLFTSGSGITVTENKTYYAVYAAQSGSGTPTNLIAYDGADGLTNLTAIDGVSNNGVGSYASSNSPYLLKFDGTGDYIQFALSSVPTSLSFDYKMIGGANASTMTIQECATVDGTYSKVEDLSISGSQNSTGTLTTSASFSKQYIRMLFTKGSNVGVGSITITGGGATYSDYSLTCGAACSNTPSMSFSAPTTVSKTTADGSFTKAVTISGKGSGQTVAYSSSDETIATVTNAGVVTLKGKGGTTTITASVEANGTYCAASASYTLNVTCALSGITLNTASVKKEFGVGESFSYSGLVVTANYTGSGCPSGTVTPTSVSTPNMSSAGTKTVTVSYTENGTTKTATYQITVKASHTVTWMACGSPFKTETYVDGASLVLPSPAPGANTAGKAFAGWTTAEYTGATAPTLIIAGSAVNADATYYAVYH